ncbi:MAG: hypothetical protein QXG56_01465, partial [Candidatus Bathyarchaeia archaeon]
MFTSCVGSFPAEFHRKSVEMIAEDMDSIGLTYPSYPQLRDFIAMFLDPLCSQGLIYKSGLEYVLSPDNAEDIEKADMPIPFEALWFIDYVRSRKLNFIGLRAPVTGVFTLASQIYRTKKTHSIRESLMNDLTFLENLASLVSKLIRKLEDLGYSLIVIDEPILSTVYGSGVTLIKHNSEDVLRIFGKLKPHKSVGGIHICGKISQPLFRLLLRSDFTLLDHEFKDIPENFKSLNPEEFKKSDKLLSVGCTSSRNVKVETVEDVLSALNRAVDLYGDKVYMAKPD